MANRNPFLTPSFEDTDEETDRSASMPAPKSLLPIPNPKNLVPVEKPDAVSDTPAPTQSIATSKPASVSRTGAPTRDDVIRRARELDVDPTLALSFFAQESSGNWNSKDSPKGAVGGMQVMPDTYFSMMGTREGMRDPWNNMEAGLRYIAYGQKKLNTRDPQLLAAGYHAGYDRKELKRGIIPNTNDGMISTKNYAASIANRVAARRVKLENGAELRPISSQEAARLGVNNVTLSNGAVLKPFEDEAAIKDLESSVTLDNGSVLKPLDDAQIAEFEKFQADEQAKIDNAPFFDRATEAGQRGFQSMVQNLTTARWALGGGDSERLAADLAAKIAENEKRSKTTGQQEIDAAFKRVTDAQGVLNTTKEGFKALGTAIANPKDTAIEIIENAPNSIPTLVTGLGGAGGGALVGSPGGVPGAVTGAIIGGRTGMVVGTTATELGAEVEQMVSERLQASKQPANAQNILAILNDKGFQSDARARGLKKGLTVAAVDQVFLGLGGKIATAPGRKIALKELSDQGVDVSTRAARRQALASPAGRVALKEAAPSVTSRAVAGTASVGVDATGETLGEGLSQKVARGEVDYGDALREGVVSVGQSVAQTGAGVAIEQGKDFVRSSKVEPVAEAPSTADGPLQRATENAAANPERVTVTAPEGTVSGQVTGRAEDGTTEIVGDDGQIYRFKVGENGVSITPEASNTPLSNALEVAAEDNAAQNPNATPFLNQGGAGVSETSDEYSAEAARAEQLAVPTAPVQADLATMDEAGLRARLKYIADQAKTNGGWNKMLSQERARIKKEINARQQQAAPEQQGEDKDKWLKSLAGENRRAGETGVQLTVAEDGTLTFLGDPDATKQGKRLAATLEEARKAGASNDEIIASLREAQAAQQPAAPTAKQPQPAPQITPQMEAAATLPKDLAGAKPRYNYGNKAFELKFDSDIDRAAYITAQGKTSSRDAEYVAFVSQATGMSEAEVRAHGRAVRDAIKSQAKDAKPGTLKVPEVARGGIDVRNTDAVPTERMDGATADVAVGAAVQEAAPAATGRESGVQGAAAPVNATNQPAKLTPISDEEAERLFGTDKKRAAAMDRIAKGTAYFGSKDKAQEFIKKNGLKDTHEVVQTGKVRFEVMAKQEGGAKQTKTDIITEHRVTDADGRPATLQIRRDKTDPSKVAEVKIKADGERQALTLGAQGVVTDEQLIKNLTDGDVINGNDNRTEGQRDGAEAVVEKADANEAERAAVQPDAGQAQAEAEVGAPLPNATAPEQVRGVDDRELGEIVSEFNDYQKGMIEDGEKITHVFDAPKKAEIVRLNDKVKVYTKDKGWMTPAEAKAEIAKWKERAQEQGENPDTRSENSQRVVLSLFDLSGEWSKPWEEAGYQVYRFDIQNDPDVGDVNNFSTEFFGDWFGDFDGQDIYAILAACPCTDFASSGARHFAAKDKDGRTVSSVKLVHQTLATIEYFKPAVWAIENPVGRIEDLGGLPPWRLSFDPNHLGDTYTKKTLLWGRFNADLPIAPVEATEGSKMWSQYGGKSLATKNARSVTPEGFSYGFFMANNAADHPAMAIANKYDRLSRKLIEKAVEAGITEDQISEVVDDPYYMELDDAAAESAIRDLIDAKKAKPAADAKPQGVDEVLRSVRRFASGLSSNGDFKRASRASGGLDLGGVGVDVGQISRNTIDAMANAIVNLKTAVFIDSGAFSAFRRGLKSGEFTPMDFDDILARYDAITDAIGAAAEEAGEVNDYPRPLLVMPDVVGDQTASIELIRKHADWIRAEVNANVSQPIIPIQKGDISMADAYREVVGIIGSDNFIVGIPSNEEAVTPSELEDFLRDAKPKAIHVLGAASDKKLLPRIESVVRSGVEGIKVTADASPIRNQVIRSVAKGAKRGDVIENLLLNQDDPALAKDREEIEAAGTVMRKDGTPFATLEKAEQALSNRGLAKTHEAVAVDGGYVLQPRGEKPAASAKPTVTPNKIFTEDAAEKARALLKQKLSGSQLNSGVDPEVLQAGITLAGYHIEKGARTFAAYAKVMIDDLGDVVKPYLKSWYMGVKFDPRAATFEGMDNAADVESADIDALTAALAEENENESAQLDEPGQGALEGTQTDLLSGVEPERKTKRGAEGSGGTDARGNERTGGGRVQQSGSVGDGAGDVSVPARRAGRGRGGEQGRGAVQRGKRAAKQDPTIESGGNDLLTPTDGQRAQDRSSDFVITDEDAIGEGGAKTKFRNNMAAIRLLKQLMSENRQATRAEQAVLAKYVGWGGIPQAFYRDNNEVSKGWEKEAAELKEALTADELDAAAASTRNAHYTSPEIVQAVWDAAKRFGFQGGRVLEPSVGVGNFFGLMPTALRGASQLTGVELDRITGGIAKYLYPQANIAAPVGFQDFSAPDNYFDLAIGNPPFGRESIYDGNRRKISGFSIHNYFFAKSIDTVKPNGVLAMVVTNRLLDSMGDKARQYIADRAEFLGAIRLPNDAFMANAGTQVTTDIIFLRKLAEGEQSKGERWMDVKQYTDKDGKQVPLNEYFVRNPDMMLGDFGAYGSMYSPDDPALIKRPGQDTPALLQEAMAKLPQNFMDPPTAEPTRETITPSRDISGVKIGSVFEQDGQIFERREDMLNQQQAAPVTFASDKAKERVSGMIRVRDALVDVRAAQLSETATEKQIEDARAALNRAYDAFVRANGPINADANKRLMRDDPSWPQIAALEDGFDKGITPAVAKTTGETPRPPSARKAAIFSKRTQSPYKAPEKANTAKDALVTSLAERGRVDLDYMASLYGRTPDMIAKELGDLIYKNPVSGWESREQYLSGNVKQKLAQALEAAKTDPSMAANIEALRAVQPADIEAVDIDVKVGAHWIPADVMKEFVETITEGQNVKALYNPVTATWTLSAERVPNSAVTQWATERAPIVKVLEAAANQKTLQIFDEDRQSGTRTLNEAATTAANEKVERVKAEWKNWIWSDDSRRERLARIYNDTFNTDVARDFDGSHLTFPGKVGNDIVELRPHQANAIWRIVQSNATLLDHVVGAGKTFTMIGGIMEMRRMGLAKKPVLVVPNHLVGQWAEDFMKLYPGANILAATKKDFEKENRKKLFARIATGDWDAVILAHSSFGKAEVEPEFQAQFIKQQIADMDTSIVAMREAEGKGSRNVKQIEKQKANLEAKLQKLFDTGSKDDNLYFSELGIDAVFVDEAHEFKNLGFSTGMQRVAGLGNPTGSQKAADLFMKVQAVLKRTGGRNIVFATGTPISNTMAEMYTMQRYLDYATLKAQGIAHFDAWAKTFGEVVTDWELSPSGQYKMNSRFAKFVNMPELMQRYQSFADVVNRDDINRMLAVQGKKLPVPKVATGKPENIVVERSNDQAQYIGVPTVSEGGGEVYPAGSLIHRSENLPKKAEKGADNMLKIMSDARKAALDMRLIDPSYPDNPASKVNVAAGNIKSIYDQTAKDKGTQLVFIDLSTPKGAAAKEAAALRELIAAAEEGDDAAQEKLDAMSPDELMALEGGKFSVYDDLKAKLIARGIPENEIAFIHDANTEIQKQELFGKVKSGRVRVLLGSTAKMGAGMNVQDRLVALHHLDAPWRPSDLEQREGRIIRQGNKLYEADPENFEVRIMRYATKQTLDSRMWQTIEAKARFIEQVRKGAGSREIEDVAGEAANSAEMKAASSGNPLILEEMTLRQQIKKLENQQTAHNREQFQIRDRMRMLASLAEKQDRDAKTADKDATKVPKEFVVKIGKQEFDKHGEAGEAILAAAEAMRKANEDSREIGTYGGFKLSLDDVTRAGGAKEVVLTIQGDAEYQIEANPGSNATGLALRLQNTVKGLAADAEKLRAQAARNRADIPKLEAQVGEWKQADELADAKARHMAVIDQLKPKKKEQPAATEGGEKPAMSRSGDDLESIFAGLDGRGKALKQAEDALENRSDADTIRYIDQNFWNILGELEDSGQVTIKC